VIGNEIQQTKKAHFKKVAAEQLKEKKLALQERKRGRTIL
jgi:hypothetical protein